MATWEGGREGREEGREEGRGGRKGGEGEREGREEGREEGRGWRKGGEGEREGREKRERSKEERKRWRKGGVKGKRKGGESMWSTPIFTGGGLCRPLNVNKNVRLTLHIPRKNDFPMCRNWEGHAQVSPTSEFTQP